MPLSDYIYTEVHKEVILQDFECHTCFSSICGIYVGAYSCSSVFAIKQNYSKCGFLNIKKIQMLPDSVVLCIVMEWSQIRRNVFIRPFQSLLLCVSLFLDCLLRVFGDQHKGCAALSLVQVRKRRKSSPESLVWGKLYPENNLIPGFFCVLSNIDLIPPPYKETF